ncbi:MAG: HPF/RaiA family ribosome-associated protein [Candidatus Nomurabacteria bacterium]|jgi:ribosomal subunit interface protein|nr:HPF/RaiA family ribosome-associated protein [Candidatus Nomurabacteria bacterium]
MQIIDITSKHITLDEKSKKYAHKKAMKLIDYIPRHARKSAAAEVKIVKNEARGGDKIECEIILNLPGKRLVAKESRDGVMAGIDGAEAKMRGQIRRYKVERQSGGGRAGGIMAALKKSLRRRK